MNKDKEIERLILKNQITEEIENNCKHNCAEWYYCIKEVNKYYESGEDMDEVNIVYDCRLAVGAD